MRILTTIAIYLSYYQWKKHCTKDDIDDTNMYVQL